MWFSLCQFRDNVLFASNLHPNTQTPVVKMIADTLSDVWDLEVLCPCTDRGEDRCVGGCLSQTAQALGISMTVGSGIGLSSTHPSALTNGWGLHFGKPLITPSRAAPECLACIFTSSLTAALPWFHSWGAQILSALSWVQVALACDYKRMAVMRAMHKTVRRVYSVSPWLRKHYARGVHDCPPPIMWAVTKRVHWLFRYAKWPGTDYTDMTIPTGLTGLQPEGYRSSWCTDIHLLRAQSAMP